MFAPNGLPGGATQAQLDRPHPTGCPENVRSGSRSGGRQGGAVTVGLANAILAQLPLAVAVVNADLRLLYWNEPAVSFFGVPRLVAADRPLLTQLLSDMTFLTQAQRDKVVEFVTAQIALDGIDARDSSFRLSLGRDRRILLQVRGLGTGRWMLVIDDGRLLAASDQSVTAAGDPWLDSLTGLSNRRHFNEVLRDMLRDAASGSRYAMLMIDLDRFRPVNETLGHSVGDSMLCLVARRLRHEARENDLLVRLGGDEFVVLLSNAASAETLAGRIVQSLSRPFLVEGHVANIGASVGIACFPEHGTTADELMRHAELALYDAKTAGGGRWRLFAKDMATDVHRRRELETDLRKALALGEMSVVYQPQLNLHTQTLSGFEALLRWTHPIRGSIPPTEFIPIAEDIGCIAVLGEWVLKVACKEAARWPAPLSVAVNVSPRQLENSDQLFQAVQAALQLAGLSPARLELEITESSLLSHASHVLEALHRLRASGIRIAMDDFGTGYSSLGQLRSFPFDKIKIDRSFIASLGQDPQAEAMIRAIAAMGRGLGMTTTAEGVETQEQAAMVKADGCTDIQGYLISRPVAASAIDAILNRYCVKPNPFAARA